MGSPGKSIQITWFDRKMFSRRRKMEEQRRKSKTPHKAELKARTVLSNFFVNGVSPNSQDKKTTNKRKMPETKSSQRSNSLQRSVSGNFVSNKRFKPTPKPTKLSTRPSQNNADFDFDFSPFHSSNTPPPPIPSNLTYEQKRAFDLALSGENVFFTGAAGTGKSFLLRELVAHLRHLHGYDRVFVTASTGIAACNIGGCTLHSFAGLGLAKGTQKELLDRVQKMKKQKRRGGHPVIQRWVGAKCLIIDEISMVDGNFFSNLELIARDIRSSTAPFGGIQLILCGDFFQLPPIEQKNSSGTQSVQFCFESEGWKKAIGVAGNVIVLQKVFRQEGDPEFIQVLNEIRCGRFSDLGRNLMRKVRVPPLSSSVSGGIEATRLYPYRSAVEEENRRKLAELKGDLRVYKAQDEVKHAMFQEHLNKAQAPETLELKIGAQVVLLKNLDASGGLVNGSRGVVVGFVKQGEEMEEGMKEDDEKVAETTKDAKTLQPREEFPVVEFVKAGRRVMGRETWSVELGAECVAKRKQIPLALAWALSIHKAQGMTLDKVEMRLAEVFEYGQAYVALSRARGTAGLRVVSFREDGIKAHPRVVKYYEEVARKMEEEEKKKEEEEEGKKKEGGGNGMEEEGSASGGSEQVWVIKEEDATQLEEVLDEYLAEEKESQGSQKAWACKSCTFENYPALIVCEMCDAPRNG